jgi:serine/threonine protein kinase
MLFIIFTVVGTCAINRKVRDVAFKEHRKLKSLKVSRRVVKEIVEDLRHEVTLMKRLRHHPNVVQIFAITFDTEGKPILVVELAYDTLDNYLYERQSMGEQVSWIEKAKLCLDIINGLRGLHEADIIHGDLKGENILVFTPPYSAPVAKISDFGYSTTMSSTKGKE